MFKKVQSLVCADRPGLEGGPSAIHQWGPKSDHFGQTCSFALRTVRALGRLLSAQSLNYSADRPTLMGGQSAGAKYGLDRDFVVFGICTTDCLEDKPGQYCL
jgi:hypothetical protein